MKMDEDFLADMEEFFTQRINWYAQHETTEVNDAYMKLRSCAERLSDALTEEQKLPLDDCMTAYHVADGETGRFYYKAGFRDAIRFLLNTSTAE